MDGSGDELLVSRGQALIAISVTSTVLAIGTCGVRFMARKQTNRGVWWDDYSVIVAMVCLLGLSLPLLKGSALTRLSPFLNR
jgi:hypothetical protein